MTDKEKVEEIINNFLRQRKFYFSDLDMARDLIKIALAEGKRVGFDEGYKKATERAYERQKDLTETFIRDGEIIKKLGEDIAELKDQKENIELAINESEEIIAELKEQIEKMKNCQNCKHDRCRICVSEIRCENLKQWELAG